MKVGDLVALTPEAATRYRSSILRRFDVVEIDQRGNPTCALLNDKLQRVKRQSGVEEHFQYPKDDVRQIRRIDGR